MPPKPTVKEAYLARRLMEVDPRQPCFVEPFAPMPVYIHRHIAFVPVDINGVITLGKLDTGADTSLITPEIAAAAHIEPLKSSMRMRGVSGSFAADAGRIDHLQLGSIGFDGPKLAHIFPFGGSHGKDVGVLVGLDWLDGLDYELDLAHDKMRPYRTTNCIEVPVPWRDTYTGLALTRGMPTGERKSHDDFGALMGIPEHVSIPVAFPGAVVDAMLDSGAPISMMSHDSALDAGVTSSQLDADPIEEVRGLSGEHRKFSVHRFADIGIGEEEMHDLPILVARHFDRRDTTMILGMDFLERHHLWLSFSTDALYIDSGEPRKLVLPLDRAHTIGGTQQPHYPSDGTQKGGTVDAHCMVEADGSLSGCVIDADGGDPALGRVTLAWLTNGAGPLMQPAFRDGKPVRERHAWHITFQPNTGSAGETPLLRAVRRLTDEAKGKK